MQLERQTHCLADSRCFEIGADGKRILVPGLTGHGAIAIAERAFIPAVTALLTRIDLSNLENIRLVGRADTVRQLLLQKMHGEASLPPMFAGWFSDECHDLMRLFGALTGANAFLVRLEVVRNDGCSRFHADNVGYRLVTTYRGAGTEWMPPPYSASVGDGCVSPTGRIEQLQTGWVAVMRGRKADTGDMPAILHRSPPMLGVEQPRLFLAIDDLDDHSLVAADNL